MPVDPQRRNEFDGTDLTGARFRKTMLNDAQFRMCDLSGVVMRDLSLSGASIDGCEIDGLTINGIEIGPLIEAELTRREPARALRRSADAEGLRAALVALEISWGKLYAKAAALPDGAVDVSVGGEWSFAETLRHMVFVTDAWLGAANRVDIPFHPLGLPFSELPEFIDQPLADLGLDIDAKPTYGELLALRADRVDQLRRFLHAVSADRLAEEVPGPVWDRDDVSVLRCLWVILNEECEHLRFAQRDLALVETGSATR